MRMMDTVGNCA